MFISKRLYPIKSKLELSAGQKVSTAQKEIVIMAYNAYAWIARYLRYFIVGCRYF
jgi:hypothetical protein